MTVTQEKAFEANIEAHLLGAGWTSVHPTTYDRKRGLFPDEVIAFVEASQPKAWAQLVTRHGGEPAAREKFVTVVQQQVDHRGTLDVLRNGVKDSGVPVKLCYFKPASGLNDEMQRRYDANRLGVVRQLHHSESNPRDSLDLALVVNGLPVASAELKNPLSGQGIEHAMAQYRSDRNPADLVFASRMLVHFAVDPHAVAMTTRLAGSATRFLPFNQGSAGPGHPGSAGNPPVDPASGGYQSAYLWEQVWQRDAWLDLLGTFMPYKLLPRAVVRRMSFALMDDRLLAAFRYPKPTAVERVLVRGGLKARGLAIRLFASPRTEPLFGRQTKQVRSYPGGHMFYSRADSQAAFRRDVRAMYALFDDGSGREFQSDPVLNIAGLGTANGERPFYHFARPVTFAPL
uniref:type I restriction endonuclease n=1 Tax=Dermacoccus nishinomiyaensis TaxID=1274 RepID=UPI00248DB251